jgi:hypothetical protein
VRRGRGADPSAPLLDAAEAEAIAETELEEGIVDSDAFAVAAADAAEEELEAEEEIEVEHELEPADLEPVDEVAEDEEPEGSAE